MKWFSWFSTDDSAVANMLNQNVVDCPDTTGDNAVSRTPPRVTPIVPKDKLSCLKPADLHSVKMKGALRANLQRNHVTRTKQRALPFPDIPKI